MIAQSDLDRIRESFPSILEHYGLDPYRGFRIRDDDRKPSCQYSKESNLVTDYGVDKRYNVFQFVGMKEHTDDFKEQAQAAARIIGLQLGEVDRSIPISPRPKAERPRFEIPAKAGFDDDVPLMQFAWLMGAGTLESDVAKGYLHMRGFCNLDIFNNAIGFVTDKKRIKGKDGKPLFTLYDPNTPRGYLVIPFFTNGTCSSVSYAMLRSIPGDKPPQNKEERPSGCKSPLYREYLLSSGLDVLFVTEGLLDCIALEKMINRPVMALGGTNFTKRLANILYATSVNERPKKIVLALDADEPGRDAGRRIAADLDALGVPHASFDMPSGCKDPNDVLMRLVGGVQDGS